MDRIEEIKELVSNYRNVAEAAMKSFGAFVSSTHKIQVKDNMLCKLSKEIGIEITLSKRDSWEYPFELSLQIDDFTLYSLATWEFVKAHKLAKKCPTCGSKV
jgi:hypothetical protein